MKHIFRLVYEHCGVRWETTWSCACNDKCPKCNAEITPLEVHDLEAS